MRLCAYTCFMQTRMQTRTDLWAEATQTVTGAVLSGEKKNGDL